MRKGSLTAGCKAYLPRAGHSQVTPWILLQLSRKTLLRIGISLDNIRYKLRRSSDGVRGFEIRAKTKVTCGMVI